MERFFFFIFYAYSLSLHYLCLNSKQIIFFMDLIVKSFKQKFHFMHNRGLKNTIFNDKMKITHQEVRG